jgi:imidazolonepropionase-like amidohydrolase
MDRQTADLVAQHEAFVVPTVAVGFILLEEHETLALPSIYVEKLRRVWDRKLTELETMKRAGVKIGLGSDLLGPLYTRQTKELAAYSQVLSTADVLKAACHSNAELLGQEGRLGCVRERGAADLLLVDGNPLEDISLLCGNGERLPVVMVGGRFHKRAL